MVSALLERVLSAERLDACFEKATEKQYTRDLLFSAVFELMSQVVFKTFSSINSAYQFRDISVSITSYNKLNGMEPKVCGALHKDTANELSETISLLKGQCDPLLPGYRNKLLHQVQKTIQPMDVYIQDRNFCVRNHLFQTDDKGAYFICRHHKKFINEIEEEVQWVNAAETGEISRTQEGAGVDSVAEKASNHFFNPVDIQKFASNNSWEVHFDDAGLLR